MEVGMATMNLVIKDAILAVARHYVKFGCNNNKFSHFGPMCGRKLEEETLALMVLEANILENQATTIAVVVLEIVETVAEAEYSNYCPKQILAGEESQRSKRETTFYYRFMSSTYKVSSNRSQLLEETHVLVSYFLFTI
jgi:hypothetical protein